jgi:uroporphyrinogen-III synthase
LTPALAATLARLLSQQNDWIITSSEALRGLCGLLAKWDLQNPDAMQHNSCCNDATAAFDRSTCPNCRNGK